MPDKPTTFGEYMAQHKVSRRSFLKFCGMITAALALPASLAGEIATALAAAPRLPVLWMEFQDCTGDSESFLRAAPMTDPLQTNKSDPSVVDLLLSFISLEYHETLMTASAAGSEKSLNDVIQAYSGQYICVIEGAIPTASNGVYCTIRGQTALSIAQNVCSKARAVVAAGSCAYDGGLPGAAPNPTGAVGIKAAVPTVPNLLSLPGCPMNVVNLTASLVYFMTYQRWPASDSAGRPLFAYSSEIHDNCPREDHYEAGRFVRSWGDDGHRQGWCLFQMGCKGPATKSNCFRVKWNQGTNWPIGAGHGCIGCASDKFWDRQGPIYQPLPGD